MKRTIVGAALLLATLVQGCGLLGAQPNPGWPPVAHCGPSVPDLVTDVSSILLNDGNGLDVSEAAKNKLTDLGIKHGFELVACLVATLRDDWTHPGASQSEHVMRAAARASDFLDDVGTKIERTQ